MSSELSEYEVFLTNRKWDQWYIGYVEYRKERNENFEYSISLTPKKKRQLMSDWIKNSQIDFCKPNSKTTTYNLPRFIGITYESRSKGKRPWKATNGRQHIDYYTTFEQACEALKKAKELKKNIVL